MAVDEHGNWIEDEDGEYMDDINPYTGAVDFLNRERARRDALQARRQADYLNRFRERAHARDAQKLTDQQEERLKDLTNRFKAATEGYDPPTQWKTHDGEVLDLAAMDDNHLQKAFEMVQKRASLYRRRLDAVGRSVTKLAGEISRRRDAKIEEERRRKEAEKAAEVKRVAKAKASAQKAYDDALAAALKETADKPLVEGRKFRG